MQFQVRQHENNFARVHHIEMICNKPSLMSLSLLLYDESMNMMMKKNTFLQLIPLEPDRDLSYLHQEEGYGCPNETYTGLASLCTLLKGILDRLISEGYCIIEEEGSSTQRVIDHEGDIIKT